MSRVIKKIALGVFQNKKILLVRSSKKDEVFYTLGGKIKEGETDIECLKREVFEEVGCSIDRDSLEFLHEFEGPAHGESGSLNIRMYIGKLIGKPKLRSEIFDMGYFDTKSPKKHLAEIAQKIIFPWLKEYGYIN